MGRHHMDFIVGLPRVGKISMSMMVVFWLSKYVHFYSLPHPLTPSLASQVFLDNIFKLHGIPTSIGSYWDLIFIRKFWQELFKL
jgi:hypothetical protein